MAWTLVAGTEASVHFPPQTKARRLVEHPNRQTESLSESISRSLLSLDPRAELHTDPQTNALEAIARSRPSVRILVKVCDRSRSPAQFPQPLRRRMLAPQRPGVILQENMNTRAAGPSPESQCLRQARRMCGSRGSHPIDFYKAHNTVFLSSFATVHARRVQL